MVNAEETKREKARNLRYKKPIVKDLNFFTIRQELFDISEKCADVKYFCETDDDTLINALDGKEDEAYEFRMMFSDLDAECEHLCEDLDDWRYSDKIEELFNLFFVAMGAGRYYDGFLGYDSYEQDYFGIDVSDEWVEEDSLKKLERMTKKDILDTARRCFRIYQSYIALRYRYDCLEASMDILRDQNTGHLQMVKEIEGLYEKAEKESFGFKYNWGDSANRLDRLLAAMPQEAWL